MASFSNSSSLMSPSDLVMAVPRIMARMGSFAFITVPERVDSMLGLIHGGSMIAEATGNGSWNVISAALSAGAPADTVVPGSVPMTAAAGDELPARTLSSVSFMHVRNFGGIFTYMTSKWAIACFTLSIILNRTQVYSATRRHVNLTWPFRLAIRIVPLLLFLSHTLTLLQALRCQTSPDFSFLKYGKAEKHVSLDFSGDGGPLYYISSALLFWEQDADSCLAADLIPSSSEPWTRRGSLSLLWPFFQVLCLGQFVETISSTIQGRPLMTETGMSIFEHSLAFAEAEAMLSNRLGFTLFGSVGHKPSSPDEATKLFTRSEILEKMNAPPEASTEFSIKSSHIASRFGLLLPLCACEVLLMALVSSLNNFSSQILGLINFQAKYRLVNTGVWGLCFMSAFIWGFFSSMRMDSGLESIVLRFPTVCIVGFIPHLLILVGIVICFSIYCLALLLCFCLPPVDGPQPRSLMDRFRLARENMQANAQLASFHLDWHEDFYTALLKVGFAALTVASEAVWLNEGERVTVSPLTWLEEEKFGDMEGFRYANSPLSHLGVNWNANVSSETTRARSRKPWRSGYSNEIKPRATRNAGQLPHPGAGIDGVGHMQRYGRYLGVGSLFHYIFWLYVTWIRLLTNKMLDKLGIGGRPDWLRLEKQREEVQNQSQESEQTPRQGLQPFWILSNEGILEVPKDDDFDAAKEIERRHRSEMSVGDWGQEQEEALESAYYDWFKQGEWGSKDESGLYQPGNLDDDTTSVVSATETDTDTEMEDNGVIDSGASTPTRARPYTSADDCSLSSLPGSSTGCAGIPLDPHPLDPRYLASLLDPKSPEERSTARIHAQHLSSPKVITRSQYRNAQTIAASRLLTSTRYRPPNSNIPIAGPLTPAEEEQLLEQLILARRSKPLPPGGGSWRDGAAGMGQGGPQCVVCQDAPRTILAFPCRCLSICEECRVSLAMNNFATCVCCRQNVVSFSRLFVP